MNKIYMGNSQRLDVAVSSTHLLCCEGYGMKRGSINVFETWCWRRLLKLKWTDRMMNDEVLQRVKEERMLLKILIILCHSWIGHIIRHKEFVVNILEGAISRKKAV
jgi:hypothetical protein